MQTIIYTESAPKALGPYSQAVEANGTLYISGQVPQTKLLKVELQNKPLR